jgi:hypothetical protein
MGFEYKKLEDRYLQDAAFNKAVNVFFQLIEEYGFTPHELRESLFLAQYKYEMSHVRKYVYAQKEMDERIELIAKLKDSFIVDAEKIMAWIK